jgi:hypothetical protein
MGIWTPEAQWVGPSPNQSGPMVEQRGMVLHVMQGSLAGSIAWGKNKASSVSFHFGTRKSDGLVQQLVDTDITAWTQCDGNGRWLSVENEDYSGNPLSAAQVESIAKLYARGVRTYGWLLQSTDSPNGRGLGWHGMGGVPWCNHPDCPGQPIKDQRPAILARAKQILTGVTPPEGDTMIAHLWKDTTGQHWYVTGPMALRQKVTAAQVENIRYYSTYGGGYTLVDLSTSAPISPAVVASLGVDVATFGGTSGPVTDEQLAELTAAAHDGAKAGAVEAVPVIVGAVDPVVRDAIADGLEGGAEKVREGA